MPRSDRAGPRARAVLAAMLLVPVGLGCAGSGGSPSPPGADDDDGVSFSDGITRMGISAYMSGDLRRAERLLKGAIAHNYRDSVARYYLSNAYVARGTPAGRIAAEEVLDGLSHVSEGNPDYLMALGRLRLDQGFRSNAEDAFQRILELDLPENPMLLTELGSLAEADWWRFLVSDDRDRALALYRRALRAAPDLAEPRIRLAVIALEEDRLEDARAHVDTLVAEHPSDLDARLLSGVVHEAAGDFTTADRAFTQALRAMPGFDRLAYDDPYYLEPDTVQVWNEMLGAVAGDDSVFVPPFWDEHDPSPGTALNERFVVHASRTAMANFLYGDDDLGLRGWETAPGEFYIRYGRPLRRRYELVGGGLFSFPTWFHLFDVGGRAVEVRFVDYTLNGRFRLPIENDPSPVHAVLARHFPENGRLGERLTTIPLLHAEGWFRGPAGEPRLRVAVAGDPAWHRAEVVVRDSTWAEVFALSEALTPERWGGGAGVGGVTVYELAIHPGPDAHRLELSLGDQGRMVAELDPAPSPEGFAVSDLWLGFLTPRGFVANPGLPVPATTPMAVRFEVYDYYRDPTGRGYLEAQVSVVPAESSANPILEAIRGRSRASFVAATLEEEPEGPAWNRELEVDVSRLSSGTYELRVEVHDTITGRTAEARRRFEVR